MDTKKNNEDENDFFGSLAPEKDNPVEREFEIGELGNQELQEDQRTVFTCPVSIIKLFFLYLRNI